jgi:predicted Zn-dependent peptidase
VAESSVISVAGPVDTDRTLAYLERAFSGIGHGAVPNNVAAPLQTAPNFRHVQHTGSQTAIHLAFRGPSDHDRLEPAVEMLLRVIDDGMATRLYHRLCDSRGLCYDVGASYEAYADTGLVELYTETAHERAQTVMDELLALTDELREHGPTPEEMDRAIRRCRWQMESMLDDPADVADYLAMAELTETAPTPARRLEELCDVTRDLVHEAAAHVFRRDGLSAVTIGRQNDRGRNKLRDRVLKG